MFIPACSADHLIRAQYIHAQQTNLIRSHCAGVGTPLSREQSRMLLALRINTLAKGHSGVRMETLAKMVDAFNADCISVIPSQGTVSACVNCDATPLLTTPLYDHTPFVPHPL